MAREIELLLAPAITTPIVTDVVAAKSQILWSVRRVDAQVTGSYETGSSTLGLSLNSVPAPNVTGLAYVDLTSAGNPDKPLKGVASIIDNGDGTIELNLVVYGGIMDYVGIVNFLEYGIVALQASLNISVGIPISSVLTYYIPYSRPVFNFDIHQNTESIFASHPDGVFTITNTISAVDGLLTPYTGTAIGNHLATAFNMYLPQGYQYGQNLVGKLLNTTIKGSPHSDFYRETEPFFADGGRLFEGFTPYFYFSHEGADATRSFQWSWLDVNKDLISIKAQHVFNVKEGINEIDVSAVGFVPPTNAKFLRYFIADGAGTGQYSNSISLAVYCPLENQIMLRWKNSLGGVDFWVFDRFFEADIDSVGNLRYQNTELLPLTEVRFQTHKFDSKIEQSFKVNARGLTLSEFKGLQKISKAEILDVMVDLPTDKTFSVFITEFSPVQYRSGDEVNFDVSLTFNIGLDVVDLIDEKTY